MAKVVSQSWKKLSDDERYEWTEMARLDRERYEREKANYKGPWKVPDIEDPNVPKPKKPLTAFFAYSNERRRLIAKANPSLSGREISSLLSQMWKECSVDEKKPYQDLEARNRQVYRQQREEWEERRRSLAAAAGAVAQLQQHDGSDVSENSVVAVSGRDSIEERISPTVSTSYPIMDTDRTTSKPAAVDFSKKQAPTTASPSPAKVDDHQRGRRRPQFIKDVLGSFHPLEPDLSGAILHRTVQQDNTAARFENYSMEDILQDDELFEDFSPSQVRVSPSGRTRSVEDIWGDGELFEEFAPSDGPSNMPHQRGSR